MNFMIHSCNKRLWYVNNYLIPSMIAQGIDKDKIIVFNDDENIGNLQNFIKSCKWIDENLPKNRGTWHLQDDVLIAKHFGSETKFIVPDSVICGFVSEKYNKKKKEFFGKQTLRFMWCSFLCIYIPNKYMGEFVEWLEKVKYSNEDYKKKYDSNRHDDFFFMTFLREKHPTIFSFNLKPNLVDHVDYLIGGSINAPRKENVTGYWFKDQDLIEDLKNKLKEE